MKVKLNKKQAGAILSGLASLDREADVVSAEKQILRKFGRLAEKPTKVSKRQFRTALLAHVESRVESLRKQGDLSGALRQIAENILHTCRDEAVTDDRKTESPLIPGSLRKGRE